MAKGQMAISPAITGTIAAASVIFVSIWVLSLVNQSITLPTIPTAQAESTTFAVNDTWYLLDVYGLSLGPNHYADTIPTLQWNATSGAGTGYGPYVRGTTVGTYQANTTHIKVLTNSSVSGYPNITAGDALYIKYTYSDNFGQAQNTYNTVLGTTWNAIQLLAVGLVVMAAVVILGYFGVMRRD